MSEFPRNCWYVAARSDELGEVPIGRRLLDQPVVMYRGSSGRPVALVDRCPHRGYPLSRGRCDGDLIVCGYHGIRYDPTGACAGVPSQEHVPYGLAVTSFPLRERAGLVWIWLGDPRRAVASEPPALPWLERDEWAATATEVKLAANYMLVHEHHLDLTHIAEAHREQTPPGLEVPPLDEVQVSERSVSFVRGLPPAPLADWEADATGLPRDGAYERVHSGTFISPAVVVEGWEIQGRGGGAGHAHVRIQAVTPETARSTHMFWRFARNYALDDAAAGEHLHAVFTSVMRVDAEILEAIESGGAPSLPYARIRADAGVLRVRRIVNEMLVAETGGAARFGVAPAAARP